MEARIARQREEASLMALAHHAPGDIEKTLRPASRRRGTVRKWWGGQA